VPEYDHVQNFGAFHDLSLRSGCWAEHGNREWRRLFVSRVTMIEMLPEQRNVLACSHSSATLLYINPSGRANGSESFLG
jgi:hypothetical protein